MGLFFFLGRMEDDQRTTLPQSKHIDYLLVRDIQPGLQKEKASAESRTCPVHPHHSTSYCILLPTPSEITEIRRALTRGPGSISQDAEHWPGTTQTFSRFPGHGSELNQAASCCQLRGFVQLSKTKTRRQVWLQLLQHHWNLIFEKRQKEGIQLNAFPLALQRSPLGHYCSGWG